MTKLLDILGTIALIVGVVLWIAIYRSGMSRWREQRPPDDDSHAAKGAE